MSIKSTIKSHVKVIIPLTVLVVGLGLLSLFILNNRPSADVAVTPPVISGTITYADGPAVPAGVKVDLTLAGKKNGKKYTKTLTDATDANGAYGFPKSSVDGLKFDKTATINAKVSSSNRKPKCTFTGDPFVVSASGTYTDKDYPCKQSDPNTSGGGGTPPGSDTTSVKPPNTWTNVSDENNGSFTNVFDYQNNEGIINNDKYYSFCETDLNSQVRAYNIKTKKSVIEVPGTCQKSYTARAFDRINKKIYLISGTIIHEYDISQNKFTSTPEYRTEQYADNVTDHFYLSSAGDIGSAEFLNNKIYLFILGGHDKILVYDYDPTSINYKKITSVTSIPSDNEWKQWAQGSLVSSNKTIDSDAVGSVIYFPYRKTIVPITSSGCDDRYGIGVSGYDTSTVPGSWIPNGKIPMLVAKNGDVYNNETSGFSANGIGNELYINTGIMFQCGKNSDATIFSKINPSSASPKWVTQPKMPIYGYNADHYDEPENKQTSYLTSANNGSDIYVFNYSHRGDPYSNENDEEDFLWKVLKYSYISK